MQRGENKFSVFTTETFTLVRHTKLQKLKRKRPVNQSAINNVIGNYT